MDTDQGNNKSFAATAATEEEEKKKKTEEEENVPSSSSSASASLLSSQPPVFSVFEPEAVPDCCVDAALEVAAGIADDDEDPGPGSNAVATAAVVAAEDQSFAAEDQTSAAAVDHHHVQIAADSSCFEFVSTAASDCGEDIDMSECLDFAQEAGEEEVAQAGLYNNMDAAAMVSESLDSELVQLVNREESSTGVQEVSLLFAAEVAKSTTTTTTTTTTGAGEAVTSGSDSGECSSGEKKAEERNCSSQRKAVGGSKNASAGGGGGGGGKKKAKVDWTPELHRRFVQAVEQLGVEKAFPSRILELMGVQCLTRHNIASHLQKYRSHRRHLAAREAEAASWSHSNQNNNNRRPAAYNSSSRLVPISPPPIQPRPSNVQPLHILSSSHAHHHHHQMLQQQQQQQALISACTPLKVWGYPTVDHSATHLWQQAPPPVSTNPPSFWQAPDGSYWQHPAAAAAYDPHAPACYPHPMRVPLATMPASSCVLPPVLPHGCSFSELDSFFSADDDGLPISMYLCNSYESAAASDIGTTTTGSGGGGGGAGGCEVVGCSNSCESPHLSKEILDAAISEALANPWTPPPLGLKPPSMEGVIAELRRQGINTVPPSTC